MYSVVFSANCCSKGASLHHSWLEHAMGRTTIVVSLAVISCSSSLASDLSPVIQPAELH